MPRRRPVPSGPSTSCRSNCRGRRGTSTSVPSGIEQSNVEHPTPTRCRTEQVSPVSLRLIRATAECPSLRPSHTLACAAAARDRARGLVGTDPDEDEELLRVGRASCSPPCRFSPIAPRGTPAGDASSGRMVAGSPRPGAGPRRRPGRAGARHYGGTAVRQGVAAGRLSGPDGGGRHPVAAGAGRTGRAARVAPRGQAAPRGAGNGRKSPPKAL